MTLANITPPHLGGGIIEPDTSKSLNLGEIYIYGIYIYGIYFYGTDFYKAKKESLESTEAKCRSKSSCSLNLTTLT
jgi:hypothetical protein